MHTDIGTVDTSTNTLGALAPHGKDEKESCIPTLSPAELRQIKADAARVPLAKLNSAGVVICKENDNLTARVEKWRVTLGKRFTGKGKERKFFETEGAAKDWIIGYLTEKKQYAKGALSSDIRTEAAECMRRLVPFGATLTEAVDYFIRNFRPDARKKCFREVAQEFIESRAISGCRASTMSNYRSLVKVANEEWGDAFVHEIKVTAIEAWVSEDEWEARTRRNYLDFMTALFEFATNRGYCIDNPARKIDRPKLEDKEIEILTPNEVRTFLLACQQFSPALVPGIAIGFFAGIRASEICALDWSEIDLSERHIVVKGIKAKTRRRRVVTICDNLLEWLKPYEQKSGPILSWVDDPSRAIKSYMLSDRRTNVLMEMAKFRTERGLPPILTNWPSNGMRHSFGSYYYAKTKDADLTSAEMGNSPNVVFSSYRAVVKPSAADEYWNILPASEATNVVPMSLA